MTSTSRPWHQCRRYELDWLRVLAFALLILYHLGMAYVADWGWHIKSQYQSEWLQYIMLWSNQWRMSLLFLISGAAVSYQLNRNAGGRFMTSTARRLLLPLLFGSLVIVAPQSFVELKVKGYIPDMNYLTFWRHYLGYPFGFGESLPAGYGRLEPAQITWNHLWYLLYLFVFIALLWAVYPLLLRLRRPGLWLAQKLPPALLYALPVLLLWMIALFLKERFPTTYLLVNDWHSNARYLLMVLTGFVLVRSNRLWYGLKSQRRYALVLATFTYAGVLFYARGGVVSDYPAFPSALETALRELILSANNWLWIMAILGYAQAWLSRPNRFMQAANDRVYCFYILHQTLIILGLYALQHYALGWMEPVLVMAITLAGCMLGYRLVKALPFGHSLMGVKASPGKGR